MWDDQTTLVPTENPGEFNDVVLYLRRQKDQLRYAQHILLKY